MQSVSRQICQLKHRLREQARSHSWRVLPVLFAIQPHGLRVAELRTATHSANQRWELACLRLQCVSQRVVTDAPLSQASQLPQLKRVACFICDPATQSARCRIHAHPSTPQIKCGSGLARECSLSVDKFANGYTAFASKPAPTVEGCCLFYLRSSHTVCALQNSRTATHSADQRWELACLRLQCVSQRVVTDPPLSQASQLPQLMGGCLFYLRSSHTVCALQNSRPPTYTANQRWELA